MTKKNSLFILIILSLFYLVNFSYADNSKLSIQIKGSDTMVNLTQAWAENFSKLHPEANIAVTGGGSGTGIAGLLNGTCEIVQSSREMNEKEITLAKQKNINPEEFIVALDGIAIVVNPKNPVKDLTIDQLRDIFMGTIKNWKEVGGENKKIVILSREVNSGTHVFFKEHVLRKGNSKGTEEFSPEALLMPSSQAIADEITQNPNAIGYYGMGYISSQQKLIAVAKDEKSSYVQPTIATVKNNSYPISRPLYMYANNKPQGIIKEFIDYAYSPEGQKIVKDIDFVPVK